MGRPIAPPIRDQGARSPGDAVVRKLRQFIKTEETDGPALARLCAHRRDVAAHSDIIEEGQRATAFYIVHDGWTCSYRNLENGQRQVTAFFLPGDICHLDFLVLDRMDHSLGAICSTVLSEVKEKAFRNFASNHPHLERAFRWEAAVTAAIQREWTANLAQRGAMERTAHLLCELFLRMDRVGLTEGNSCEIPLTQTDIADALGMTPIHVNRMLQQMRGQGLIALKNHILTIVELETLQKVGGFDAGYLHLEEVEHVVRSPHGNRVGNTRATSRS